MRATYFIIDKEGMVHITSEEKPIHRTYIVEHCFRDNYSVYYQVPREDGLPGSLMKNAFNKKGQPVENKTYDECREWVNETYKEYQKSLAQFKQSGLKVGNVEALQTQDINRVKFFLNHCLWSQLNKYEIIPCPEEITFEVGEEPLNHIDHTAYPTFNTIAIVTLNPVTK